MLLVKIRNSAELFWETLDPQERRLVAMAAFWLLGSVLALAQSKARERRRNEIIDTIGELMTNGRQ